MVSNIKITFGRNLFFETISFPPYFKMHFTNEMMILVIPVHPLWQSQRREIHWILLSNKFLKSLSRIEHNWHDCVILRCALLSPEESPWRQVNGSGIDCSDWVRFWYLPYHCKWLQIFYNNYSPYSKDETIVELEAADFVWHGWPRLVAASDGLGLVLTWTRTLGSTMVLQLLFGMAQTSISDCLAFCTHGDGWCKNKENKC